jgi:hypothetical protein
MVIINLGTVAKDVTNVIKLAVCVCVYVCVCVCLVLIVYYHATIQIDKRLIRWQRCTEHGEGQVMKQSLAISKHNFRTHPEELSKPLG